MKRDESAKVEAVLLEDGQWHEINGRSFRTFVADSRTSPTPDSARPFLWYSFEKIDGQTHQGLASDIKELRFESEG